MRVCTVYDISLFQHLQIRPHYLILVKESESSQSELYYIPQDHLEAGHGVQVWLAHFIHTEHSKGEARLHLRLIVLPYNYFFHQRISIFVILSLPLVSLTTTDILRLSPASTFLYVLHNDCICYYCQAWQNWNSLLTGFHDL